MNRTEKISVIIPTYKRNKQLVRCLYSLLNQSKKPDEIIIVDNSSDQQARTVFNKLKEESNRLQYINEPKKGAANARNRGMRNAHNNLLAFIDDDCVAHRNWVKEILLFMNQKQNVIAMGNNKNGLQMNLTSAVEYYFAEQLFRSNTIRRNNREFSLLVDTKNVAMRKSLLLKKSLYFDNKTPQGVESIVFSIQLLKKGIPIIINPRMVVYHFGSDDLFTNIKHQFYKGLALSHITTQRDVSTKEIKNSTHNIKKTILKNSKWSFRILFQILVHFDCIITRLGAIYGNIFIHQQRMYTQLPRFFHQPQ